MVFVCIGIGLAIVLVGLYCYSKADIDVDFSTIVIAIGLIITVISMIAILVLGISCSCDKLIPQKIEMYTAENEKIENGIAEMVAQYQQYEAETYDEFRINTDNVVAWVNLYPDLKSDELVEKQVEIYMENQSIIRELKADEINAQVRKWWLYFG